MSELNPAFETIRKLEPNTQKLWGTLNTFYDFIVHTKLHEIDSSLRDDAINTADNVTSQFLSAQGRNFFGQLQFDSVSPIFEHAYTALGRSFGLSGKRYVADRAPSFYYTNEDMETETKYTNDQGHIYVLFSRFGSILRSQCPVEDFKNAYISILTDIENAVLTYRNFGLSEKDVRSNISNEYRFEDPGVNQSLGDGVENIFSRIHSW